MPDNQNNSPLPDMCLMLRAHAEQLWLTRQVAPVLRQLEQPRSIPGDQLGAALAYLEVLWIDACTRAAESDIALARLTATIPNGNAAFHAEARSYYYAVRTLRDAVARHVAELLAPPLRPPTEAPLASPTREHATS
jgi:hypothetical protein